MKSSYKRLGDFIQEVNIRNSDLKVDRLLGVSIRKVLIPSIANTIGTDMSKYKVVKRRQFAYGPVTSRNGDKISVAILYEFDNAIISQSYKVFEVINEKELLPEYLMMWFRRPEFDRYARYMSHGSTRETFDWDELCEVELPVPSPAKQQAIVDEYNVITRRISILEQLNAKLEETAQTIYKHWFVDFEFPDEEGNPYKSSGGKMVWNEELGKDVPVGWEVKMISEIIPVKDGTHDSPRPQRKGHPLVTSTHLNRFSIDFSSTYLISEMDYRQINRRSEVHENDILISMIGTVGSFCFVQYSDIDFAIKNVGLFKTSLAPQLARYIFLYMTSNYIRNYINSNLSGSTQSYITLTFLRNIPIYKVSKNILIRFNQVINSQFNNIQFNTTEIQNLLKLRRVILSKMHLL